MLREHLPNLDIGLPVADVRPVVREALADPAYYGELILDAINRRPADDGGDEARTGRVNLAARRRGCYPWSHGVDEGVARNAQ
ncbi:hypothetical protein [Amycolatopsis sp.]|uniref:hypothetical protein n=1 Tax=Amycolatopsis sp. TaxID=37632 RepID=UPI002D80B746|nr:hypothetical protein [Amycolatopsis sp.]HET6709149.1 hypothetical protein [Amycolatopsis sp.]